MVWCDDNTTTLHHFNIATLHEVPFHLIQKRQESKRTATHNSILHLCTQRRMAWHGKNSARGA